MLKTVKDACILHENALEIRVSDQIEQLDELIKAEDDGRAFFKRTHITQGMRDLVVEGIACGFRSIATSHFGMTRPPVSEYGDHLFRSDRDHFWGVSEMSGRG